MATLAERMRKMTTDVRGNFKTYREYKDSADITAFFEEEVKKGAISKIEKRASRGHFTSNVLEYGYKEYFYVTSDGRVIRVPKFERIPGAYLHSIYNTVHGETFQKMLNDFVTDELGMKVSCWYPGKDAINVITVNWGLPQQSDEEDNKSTNSEEKEQEQPKEEAKPKKTRGRPKKTKSDDEAEK